MDQYIVLHQGQEEYNMGVVLGIYNAESHEDAVRQWIMNLLSVEAGTFFEGEMSLDGAFSLATSLLDQYDDTEVSHKIKVYKVQDVKTEDKLELEGTL